MKIQVGKIYMNKTQKYLLPCLKAYGEEFEKKFNAVFKVAVGVGDMILVQSGVSYEQHLFILLDITNGCISNPKAGERHFKLFIKWVRQQDMYEDDYAFDSLSTGKLHMVIIKLPQSCYKALHQMRRSQFSKMYSLEEVETYFKDKPNIRRILVKDRSYKIEFSKQLNALFESNISEKEAQEMDGELDFPTRKEEEVFNGNIGLDKS